MRRVHQQDVEIVFQKKVHCLPVLSPVDSMANVGDLPLLQPIPQPQEIGSLGLKSRDRLLAAVSFPCHPHTNFDCVPVNVQSGYSIENPHPWRYTSAALRGSLAKKNLSCVLPLSRGLTLESAFGSQIKLAYGFAIPMRHDL